LPTNKIKQQSQEVFTKTTKNQAKLNKKYCFLTVNELDKKQQIETFSKFQVGNKLKISFVLIRSDSDPFPDDNRRRISENSGSLHIPVWKGLWGWQFKYFDQLERQSDRKSQTVDSVLWEVEFSAIGPIFNIGSIRSELIENRVNLIEIGESDKFPFDEEQPAIFFNPHYLIHYDSYGLALELKDSTTPWLVTTKDSDGQVIGVSLQGRTINWNN
jgi:hypothetical protein